MAEVGVSAALHSGLCFFCRSFTRKVLCPPCGEPIPVTRETFGAYQVPLTKQTGLGSASLPGEF